VDKWTRFGYVDLAKTDGKLVLTWSRFGDFANWILLLGLVFCFLVAAVATIALDNFLLFHSSSLLGSQRRLLFFVFVAVPLVVSWGAIGKLIQRRKIGYKTDVFTFDRTLDQFLRNAQTICPISTIRRVYVDYTLPTYVSRLTLEPKRLTKMRFWHSGKVVMHVAKEIADYTGLKLELEEDE
jgi:hypothetical protein